MSCLVIIEQEEGLPNRPSLATITAAKEIGDDEEKSYEKNVQNITDKHIATVDEKVSSKEKEIMTI